MKKGMTISEFASEIVRQNNNKRDYIAPTNMLGVSLSGKLGINLLHMLNSDIVDQVFSIQDTAYTQILEHTGVPRKFADRLHEKHADILEEMINKLFQREPSRRLVRTLDGKARAFLSEYYRPLDNNDLAETVFPVLSEAGKWEIETTALTDTRLYIKATVPAIQAEVKKGDIVRAGIIITNSEVGLGSLKVEPLIYRLACLNGMIVNELAQRTRHIGGGGRHGGDGLNAEQFYKTDTRAASDKAILLKMRDTVEAMISPENFDGIVNRLREASETPIPSGSDLVQLVERTGKAFQMRESEGRSVLEHLIRGGELSKWGLANAVTRAAQDVVSFDRSIELERAGNEIITLSGSQWREVLN